MHMKDINSMIAAAKHASLIVNVSGILIETT